MQGRVAGGAGIWSSAARSYCHPRLYRALLLAQNDDFGVAGKSVVLLDPTEILARKCVAWRRTHRFQGCHESLLPHLRLYLVGAVILMAGLVAAVKGIFQTASDRRADVIRYEIIDGVAYPVLASESKSYRSDLERFGGKARCFCG